MFKNISKEELVIPASMGRLREIRDFIEHIGKRYRYDDKIINSFKLVVDEACSNIIRHGYRDIKDGEITVRAIVRRLSLTIVIVDQGKSFDPRQVQNPDLDKYVKIGKKGGLGIFMMRKLMDDMQYNITAHGNELRLTKLREAPPQSKFQKWSESLTIRQKFFLTTGAIIIIAMMIAYFVFESQIESRIQQDVFAEATTITTGFAKSNWDLLNEENDILLNLSAKSIWESNPNLISVVMVLQQDSSRIALHPFHLDQIGRKFELDRLKVVESAEKIQILAAPPEDSVSYYFVSPIKIEQDQPLGYALTGIASDYIHKRAVNEKLKLSLYLLTIVVIGISGIGFLVTRITRPFHKLAEWVRLMGHGQVDQDEIDIDATDEVGEIAQAFNEMTNKFRQAQVSVIEQQRMHKELQVAQEIQQMLLPDDFPEVVGYDISSYYQSAKEVGGDLFDFVEVDDQSIGICVADVSGKGIPGSLVMTMIRTSLRLETRGNKNPSDILTKVNGFVTDDIRKGMFVTMFYVILDSRERMVSFCSAGHNPMILYRGKSKETYYLNPSGFPVGITLPDIRLFGDRIQADRIRLHPDDILVLYTDGITEAMNPNRELYGEERFLAAIRKYGHLDVVEFVKSIKDDILGFAGGFEQNDDITLVAIKENMAAVDVKINMFKQMFEQTQEDNDKTVAEICQEAGISPTTFYRYRRLYREGGYDLLREMLHGYTNLGLRHLSIEIKTKMYDVIRKHPEFGPKKISDLLNTEKYGFTEVSPLLIYEELRRAKLNTREQRERFVKRGGKQRLKPPGTPLLTLDGEVLVGFSSEDQPQADLPFMPDMRPKSRAREKIITSRGKTPEQPDDKDGRAAAQQKMRSSDDNRSGIEGANVETGVNELDDREKKDPK